MQISNIKAGAKIGVIAVGIPTTMLLWALGFIAASFTYKTIGSAAYLAITTFCGGFLAYRFW